jgi:hypothetical protein
MRKDYKLIIFIGILLCISLVIGTSYALWSINHTQANKNDLATGCFSTTFTESNDISLSNAFPITDTAGKKLTPYTFTITNTCTIASNYQINLEVLNTTTAGAAYIKTELNTDTPALLSSLTTVTKTLDAASTAYEMKTGYLAPSKSATYNLRLWVDEAATTDNMSNKTFSAKVVVITSATPKQVYADATGANVPELYQGLVPVKYDASGNTVVADIYDEWYNYSTHNWANAVLVNCADSSIKSKYFDDSMKLKDSIVGTTITDSDILQYYVWIPRYKYLLWNAENGSSDPQAISITFEDKTATKSTGSTNGTWLTHPAFTFGTTELNGIWVGKFETSGTVTNLTIKPNVVSLTNQTVSAMFNATRDEENTYAANYGISSSEIDTHMMKNMEWGAVAYLSSSIYGRYTNATTCIASGCEVWINNVTSGSYVGAVTGCSGATVSADEVSQTTCSTGYDWTTLGVNASTTGNQYGIYDMSGGAYEYVMGNMVGSDGNFYSSSAGFSVTPDSKYYNSYNYQSDVNIYTDHSRGLLGDATKETLKTFGSETGGWNSDYAFLPSGVSSWFKRGGYASYGDGAGVFDFHRHNGVAHNLGSFRSVLSAQ